MNRRRLAVLLQTARPALAAVFALSICLAALPARAEVTGAAAAAPPVDAARRDGALPQPAAPAADKYRLGAHFELDVGVLIALRQSAAFAGGVVYGPFRAGLSYATFLSNASLGGVPDGFTLRANYIIGLNASYFIARSTDDGLYVQAMFHIKQQGVTNIDSGDQKNLNSLAAGLELGYVWKVYRGLYVCPRIGALYYLKRPQGPDDEPVLVGDKYYDNDRHKAIDSYLIPTLSVGYSW